MHSSRHRCPPGWGYLRSRLRSNFAAGQGNATAKTSFHSEGPSRAASKSSFPLRVFAPSTEFLKLLSQTGGSRKSTKEHAGEPKQCRKLLDRGQPSLTCGSTRATRRTHRRTKNYLTVGLTWGHMDPDTWARRPDTSRGFFHRQVGHAKV
jgi:hypothetical protein